MTNRVIEFLFASIPFALVLALSALIFRLLLYRTRKRLSTGEAFARVARVYIQGIILGAMICSIVVLATAGVGGFREVFSTICPTRLHVVLYGVGFWNVAAVYAFASESSSNILHGSSLNEGQSNTTAEGPAD